MTIQGSQITQNYNSNSKGTTLQERRTAAEIQNWLVSYLAELLRLEVNEIDVTIPFDRYGLDSATAIGLTGDLEEWLGIDLDPTLIYDYPSVELLVRHLVEQFNT
uniref:Acyl carrier protein n=1 Tax=Nostoc sp. UIC 10110 TaxID=1929948 RepID=A0A1P8YWI3_9NOSO|nr:acyl carrier protein [Nostoc sp. UIC 10110]